MINTPRKITSPTDYFGIEQEPVADVVARATAIGDKQRDEVKVRNQRLRKIAARTGVAALAVMTPIGQNLIPDGLPGKLADVAHSAYDFVDQGENTPAPGSDISRQIQQEKQQDKVQSNINLHQSGASNIPTTLPPVSGS